MTSAQAIAAGLTRRQIRTLVESGWGHPFMGVMVEPRVADPFERASARRCSPVLRRPPTGVTAARLRGLWGLPRWTGLEEPELILPAGRSFNTRKGLRLHKGLLEHEWQMVDSFPTADLERTVCQLSVSLNLDDLVCAVDFSNQ